MDMPYFAIVYAENQNRRVRAAQVRLGTPGRLVAMVTCVVLEPDGVQVERRRQVQDVRTTTLQQVRDDQLRPETHRRSLTEAR